MKESLFSSYKRLQEIKKSLLLADDWFLKHSEEDKSWAEAERRMNNLIDEASTIATKLA
jgi:hypothetical protein